MKKSPRIHEMSSPVLAMIERLLIARHREGKLAADIDPLRLYVMIAALSQFHLTNVHTLSIIFEQDLSKPEWRAKRRADASARCWRLIWSIKDHSVFERKPAPDLIRGGSRFA